MITTLVFQEGDQRLEIECPDGGSARALLARVEGMEVQSHRVRVVREIGTRCPHDRVLDVFNGDDDKFMRDMRDRAQIKIVHVPDPGSVAGRYAE